MLEKRSVQTEQMDDLSLSGERLTKTLDGLTVINKFFGNTNSTLDAVKRALSKSKHALKIIDLGCGGGDNLRAIEKWCNSQNIEVELLGIDGNENILEYARSKNGSSSSITYTQADILKLNFQLPKCDLLISSHFMYHFSDQELTNFLAKSKTQVTGKMFFSELERSTMAYFLFKVASPLLPFSSMVKQDGLLAIKRAFRKKELQDIIEKAGIASFQVRRKWAFRFLVEIDCA